MEFSFKEDLFYAILNLLWNILTWGWVDWALFILFFIIAAIIGLGLLSERGVVIYILKEKYIFLKEYSYIWLRQHISFVRGYLHVLNHQKDQVNWRVWLVLFICLCIIVGAIVGVYFYFSPVEEVLV